MVRLKELAPGSTDALTQAITELKTNPFSKEAVVSYWRAKLQADGEKIGLVISVPACDWTEEKIGRPMKDIQGKKISSMMVYVPQELTRQEGLRKLGQMYPEMNSWSVQEDTLVRDNSDVNEGGGWIKVEATVNAPNLNTTQKSLGDHVEKQRYSGQRYSGQRLNTYILAAQASKDLTGHYLDDEGLTVSRLLGSCLGTHVVRASFHPDGSLDVRWYLPSSRCSLNLGGRFEEAKKD